MSLTNQGIATADMLLFAAVVDHGSFTAAARANGVSKQAVSERIGKLEAQLGVRLLQRTTRSIKPTEAGERYHHDCKQIAELIGQANERMQAEQAEPVGKLTVSAPLLFGRGQLIEVFAIYRERFPKVTIELKLTDRLVNLVEEGVDVALRVSQLNDSSLSVRRLGTVHALLVCSPKLLQAHQGKNEAEMLRTASALSFRSGEVWDMPDGAKIKPNTVLCIDDLVALSAAAVAGLGIARLPSLLCRDAVARGELKVLLGGVPAAQFSVYAAYLSKKQLAPKIRSLIDVLVEHAGRFVDEL